MKSLIYSIGNIFHTKQKTIKLVSFQMCGVSSRAEKHFWNVQCFRCFSYVSRKSVLKMCKRHRHTINKFNGFCYILNLTQKSQPCWTSKSDGTFFARCFHHLTLQRKRARERERSRQCNIENYYCICTVHENAIEQSTSIPCDSLPFDFKLR